MVQSAVAGTLQIDGFSSTATCYTPPAGYTPPATPPALPATAKYHPTSLLSDGTVNSGIAGYLTQPFPCDNCYYVGPKTGQPNPITFKLPSVTELA